MEILIRLTAMGEAIGARARRSLVRVGVPAWEMVGVMIPRVPLFSPYVAMKYGELLPA